MGCMHVISRKVLRLAARRHPAAAGGLEHWYRVARQAEWRNIQEVRQSFPHADAVVVDSGNIATVFNICGNNFRMITVMHYNRGKVYVTMILTHAEYSRDKWKGLL
jgi:mRNA interferase HigB